jgi:hypothetical protein
VPPDFHEIPWHGSIFHFKSFTDLLTSVHNSSIEITGFGETKTEVGATAAEGDAWGEAEGAAAGAAPEAKLKGALKPTQERKMAEAAS